jgi:very-short-patch-repair endonuclease
MANEIARGLFRGLRFWNHEIDRNLDGVLTLIHNKLSKPRPAELRSATLPLRGRDRAP